MTKVGAVGIAGIGGGEGKDGAPLVVPTEESVGATVGVGVDVVPVVVEGVGGRQTLLLAWVPLWLARS